MSRLSGGIGTRGPGETKLETHRRRIDDRLARLNKELEHGQGTLSPPSHASQKELPVMSLVGYTNAGKSTLLNTLTNSDIVAEDSSSPPLIHQPSPTLPS